MIAETQIALRNSGWVVAQQAAQMVSGLLFAVLVVRLMGPEMYGRYAVLTALLVWFFLLGGLGFNQVIARYVPEYRLAGDADGLARFLGSVLGIRMLSAAGAAALYLALTRLWLRDLDPVTLVLMAGALCLRCISQFFYSLFLGLNRAERWGMNQVLREWVTLGLIIPGVRWLGLRGAGWALLGTEIIVLFVALVWARSHLRGLRLGLRASAHLRFALIFFAGSVLLTAFQYSGEPLVRALSLDYTQVAYFGLAYNIYLTVSAAMGQLAHSFVPWWTALWTRGHSQELQVWVERLIKWLTMGGMAIMIIVLFLGEEAIVLVFGAAYRPVAVHLIPLALATVALALSYVAYALTVVCERPEAAWWASALRAASFWALGIPLIAWKGSLGGCIAVLAAVSLHAAYLTMDMRRAALPYSLRSWGWVVALGALFWPLGWLHASSTVRAALCGAALIGYGGLLLAARLVTPVELRTVWQTVRRREEGGA